MKTTFEVLLSETLAIRDQFDIGNGIDLARITPIAEDIFLGRMVARLYFLKGKQNADSSSR